MKKNVMMGCIWLILAAMLFAACGKTNELPREIDICLDGYAIEDGMLSFAQEDPEGNKLTNECDSLRILGAPGETIADALDYWKYSDLVPVKEDDVFEGWMECEYDVSQGTYVIVSQELISTKALLALPVPDSVVTYVAKWQSIPVEEYFVTEPVEDYRADSGFAFIGSGGSLCLRLEDGSQYTAPTYSYWLQAGQTLEDVMDPATLLDVQLDGAEFLGWTLYQAEEMFWGDESTFEEGLMCMTYDEDRKYVMLRDAQQIGENMTTEELMQITCYGESYLAVANWG